MLNKLVTPPVPQIKAGQFFFLNRHTSSCFDWDPLKDKYADSNMCVWEVLMAGKSRNSLLSLKVLERMLSFWWKEAQPVVLQENPPALSRLVYSEAAVSSYKKLPYCTELEFHPPCYRLHLPKLLLHNRLPTERANV